MISDGGVFEIISIQSVIDRPGLDLSAVLSTIV
jgi:hypothetical protein